MSKLRALFASLALAAAASQASAASVTTQLSSVDADTWQIQFDLTNTGSITSALEGITFTFDAAAFNLSAVSATPGWDLLVLQPDASPSPGLADALALGAPLGVGQQAQFVVNFDWTGAAPPSGVLPFEVYTQTPAFSVLGAGVTSAVPEPTPLLMALAGAGLLWARQRRRGAA